MRYGSVCSGIEAATVAWHSLGFEPSWFSEIDKAPSLILDHHYPNIKNLGDMTCIREKVRRGEVEAPDILVGGTPCQAYSVAGLRQSLDDERGQLTLEYVRLLDAIDDTRSLQGEEPCIAIWENVPGVLNTKDNAFGCFLGGLAGSGCELKPSGKKWPNAGCVLGPSRQVYWRVLDAQHFGLAQRRKRVFVVASARTESIGEILFERKSVHGDSTQGSSKRKGATSNRTLHTARASETLSGKTYLSPLLASHGEKKWLGNQEAFCGDYYIRHVVGIGGMTANAAISRELYPTLLANHDRGYIVESYGVNGNVINQVNNSGSNGNGCKHELSYTLTSKRNAVVYGIQGNIIWRSKNAGGNGWGFKEEQAPTLTSMDRHGVVVHGTQDPIISCDIAHCLGRNSGQENVLCETAYAMIADTTPKISMQINGTLRSSGGGGVVPSSVIFMSIARYLTEIECERPQGFPDNYTNVPKVANGKRYKALGNSMAVNVMHWIGKRLRTYLMEATYE
ncbi:DNA cytosine methyltransferase [Acinetobacter venetianus]|uniref:DNA (cytosine-5-)-methyltransferase n=1 Tax=Acinetobacter venetianus TaxID=52133 RepID=A0A150HQJ0_9GAMM|nr:DNA cytosine methyltransferase [Acinetobacter venetianus]KXZ68795.1 putative BsuMI modification methylase subunit YdiP [Acinetobacter venetianus]